MTDTTIRLVPEAFGQRETLLVEHGELSASTFRFESGVLGLRLRNGLGSLVMLPYQGQQVWSAEFQGRNLTMKSMFDQPMPTQAYLETYGGFLLHCGATTMGVPTGDDTHPLHGELPNAPYRSAYLQIGRNANGEYLALGGRYQHTVAFQHNYLAEPLVKLYAGPSIFRVELSIVNLKRSEMELMYLAHINFRPVANGRLVYSAHCTPEHVRVRRSIPSHVHPKAGYVEFLDELAEHPERHNVMLPDLLFDPEVVLFVDYLADERGWSHTMQVHPDGSADYVAHRPSQLDTGVRWISRTADQDAMGMVLPATAEPEGYLAERAKGNLKYLPPGGKFYVELEMGAMAPAEAMAMKERINRLLEGNPGDS